MNQVFGFALAAATVAGIKSTPVVTMTSKSCSTIAWMSGA